MSTAPEIAVERPGTAQVAVPRARRPRRQLSGWGFAAPWVALFAVFTAGPILASFAMSFTDFGLRDLRNPIGTNFIGVDNYAALFSDASFLQAALNTAYFVVVGVPLTLAAGLVAALGLNSAVLRFRSLFRVGYYLPVVTSIVAIAVVWRYVLQPDVGLANLALSAIGIDGPNWLASPVLAMPTIIVLAVWRNFGFVMIVYLAGLQGIPTEMVEASSIDGATRWQRFRHVTLPLLRPTTLFAAVTTSIGYLQVFEEPFVMTDGGPLDRTLTVSMYLYEQGFDFLQFGYASAIAYMLFIAIVVLAVLQFRLLRSDA